MVAFCDATVWELLLKCVWVLGGLILAFFGACGHFDSQDQII